MSDPFVQPVVLQEVRLALRQHGVSQMGANEFLEGRPVSASSDRLLLAQLFVQAVRSPFTAVGRPPIKPAEFKPAEFKRARR
jgi:hypothetical protein